jgi:hypothetical protein
VAGWAEKQILCEDDNKKSNGNVKARAKTGVPFDFAQGRLFDCGSLCKPSLRMTVWVVWGGPIRSGFQPSSF